MKTSQKRRTPARGVSFEFLVLIALLLVFAAIMLDIAEARQRAADAYIDSLNQAADENRFAGIDSAPSTLDPVLVDEPLPVQAGSEYDPRVPLSEEDQASLKAACNEFDILYPVALGVIEKETNFRNIPGDSGDSQGFMQVQRKWWSGLMDEIGATDLTVPEDNFRTGCAVLRSLLDRYSGNYAAALTAYNAGRDNGSREYASAVIAYAGDWGLWE